MRAGLALGLLALICLSSCRPRFRGPEEPLRALVAEARRDFPSSSRARNCFGPEAGPESVEEALDLIRAASYGWSGDVWCLEAQREGPWAEYHVSFSGAARTGPWFGAVVSDAGDGWVIQSIDLEPLRTEPNGELRESILARAQAPRRRGAGSLGAVALFLVAAVGVVLIVSGARMRPEGESWGWSFAWGFADRSTPLGKAAYVGGVLFLVGALALMRELL